MFHFQCRKLNKRVHNAFFKEVSLFRLFFDSPFLVDLVLLKKFPATYCCPWEIFWSQSSSISWAATHSSTIFTNQTVSPDVEDAAIAQNVSGMIRPMLVTSVSSVNSVRYWDCWKFMVQTSLENLENLEIWLMFWKVRENLEKSGRKFQKFFKPWRSQGGFFLIKLINLFLGCFFWSLSLKCVFYVFCMTDYYLYLTSSLTSWLLVC